MSLTCFFIKSFSLINLRFFPFCKCVRRLYSCVGVFVYKDFNKQEFLKKNKSLKFFVFKISFSNNFDWHTLLNHLEIFMKHHEIAFILSYTLASII